MMLLGDRVQAFKRAFAKWPASWPWLVREQKRDVLYGVWVIGNDYRNRSRLYGAYPAGFVDRVMALFPDSEPDRLLHAFSGSLPRGPYSRIDVVDRCLDADPRFHLLDVCDAYLVDSLLSRFKLVIADPPYSKTDAERYGTPMVNRRRALISLAGLTRPGGHCVWLDTCWPMHRKEQWQTVGRILLQRSTNHRARVVTIFERRAS